MPGSEHDLLNGQAGSLSGETTAQIAAILRSCDVTDKLSATLSRIVANEDTSVSTLPESKLQNALLISTKNINQICTMQFLFSHLPKPDIISALFAAPPAFSKEQDFDVGEIGSLTLFVVPAEGKSVCGHICLSVLLTRLKLEVHFALLRL